MVITESLSTVQAVLEPPLSNSRVVGGAVSRMRRSPSSGRPGGLFAGEVSLTRSVHYRVLVSRLPSLKGSELDGDGVSQSDLKEHTRNSCQAQGSVKNHRVQKTSMFLRCLSCFWDGLLHHRNSQLSHLQASNCPREEVSAPRAESRAPRPRVFLRMTLTATCLPDLILTESQRPVLLTSHVTWALAEEPTHHSKSIGLLLLMWLSFLFQLHSVSLSCPLPLPPAFSFFFSPQQVHLA